MIRKVEVDIQSSEVQALFAALGNMPASILPALLEAVDEGTQVVLGHAQRERFRGKGPFPVSKRKLGVVTGLLRKSLFAGKPRVTGPGEVSVQVGSNVKYFGVHEFGFSGRVQVRAHTRSGRAGGAVQVQAHSRRMKVPKRAPLAAAFEDHSQRVYGEVFAEKLAQLLDAQ